MADVRLDLLYYELEARTAPFDAAIARAREQLRTLEKPFQPVEVKADTTPATRAIDTITKRLETLVKSPPKIEPKVESKPATDAIEQVDEALEDLGDTGGNTGSLLEQVAELAGARFLNLASAAAAAAIAVAGIVSAAVREAAAVDGVLNSVENRIGAVGGASDRFRTDVRNLSDASGLAQEKIGELFEGASENGAVGASAVRAVVVEVLRLRDAVGGDGAGLSEGLAKLARGFGIAEKDLSLASAGIFASAQGIANVEDLLSTVADLGPAAQRANLTFEQTTAAVRALVQEGRTLQDAGAEIDRLSRAGEGGRDALLSLGEAGIDYAAAVDVFNAATSNGRESVERLSDAIKTRLRNELTDLGNSLLPAAYTSLKTLSGVLEFQGPLWQRLAMGIAGASAELARLRGETEKPLGISAAQLFGGKPTASPFSGAASGAFGGGLGTDVFPVAAAQSIGSVANTAGEALRAIVDASKNLKDKSIGDLEGYLSTLNRIGPTSGQQRAEVDALAKSIQSELNTKLREGTREQEQAARQAAAIAERFADASRTALQYGSALGITNDPLRALTDRQANLSIELDKLIAKLPVAQRAAATTAKKTIMEQLADGAERLRAVKAEELTSNLAGTLASISGDAIAGLTVEYDRLVKSLEDTAKEAEALNTVESNAAARRAREAIPAVKAERDALIVLEQQRRRLTEATKTLTAFEQTGNANFKDAAVSIADRNRALMELEEQERTLMEQLAGALPSMKVRLELEKQLVAVRKELADQQGGAARPVASIVEAVGALGSGLATAAQNGLTLVQILGQGNTRLSSMLAAVSSIGQGIAGVSSLAGAAGGFGALFSSGAGAVSALGPIAAVAGGLTALSQAFDLFGTRERERARQIAAAAAEFNRALDEFAIQTRTSLEEALRRNVQGANALITQAASANGLTRTADSKPITSADDLAKMIEMFRSADLGKFGPAFEGFIQGLEAIYDELIENEAKLTAINAAEISRLQDNLNIRKLVVAGMSEEAIAARAQLDIDEEIARLRDRYGTAAEDYIEDLIDVTEAEEAAAAAIRVRTAALQQLDDQLAILGGTPIENLQTVIARLSELFPALGGIADGLDLGAGGGIDALRERLRDLFRVLDADGISEAERPIVDAIRRILGMLDSLPSALDPLAAALEAFGVRVEVFGLSAAEQIEGLAAIFAGQFAGLDEILGSIDLTTEDGRNSLRDRLQSAIGDILADGVGTDEERPLLEALQRFFGLVNGAIEDAANDAAEAAANAAAARRARIDSANAEIAVRDLSGLDAFAVRLRALGPAFSDLFGAFDLSSIEGVEAAKAALWEMLKGIDDGTISLEAFGGMTRDEVVAAILGLDSSLDTLKNSALAAAEAARALAEQQRDFTQNVDTDYLRASGRNREADLADLDADIAAKVARARELMLSEAVIAQIIETGRLRRIEINQRYDQDEARAAQASAESAAKAGGAAGNRRSEFIASAVTEISSQQALQITDYLAASLIEHRGTRLAVEAMAVMMGSMLGTGLPALRVPALPPGSGGPTGLVSGGGITLIVNFNGPLTGREAAEDFIEAAGPMLDEYVARSASSKAKNSGRTLT